MEKSTKTSWALLYKNWSFKKGSWQKFGLKRRTGGRIPKETAGVILAKLKQRMEYISLLHQKDIMQQQRVNEEIKMSI